MKLNIIQGTASVSQLDKRLGVNKDRIAQLEAVVIKQVNIVRSNLYTPHLTDSYKILAEACENIEEYTICMHTFLFMITKTGKLTNDEIFTN